MIINSIKAKQNEFILINNYSTNVLNYIKKKFNNKIAKLRYMKNIKNLYNYLE